MVETGLKRFLLQQLVTMDHGSGFNPSWNGITLVEQSDDHLQHRPSHSSAANGIKSTPKPAFQSNGNSSNTTMFSQQSAFDTARPLKMKITKQKDSTIVSTQPKQRHVSLLASNGVLPSPKPAKSKPSKPKQEPKPLPPPPHVLNPSTCAVTPFESLAYPYALKRAKTGKIEPRYIEDFGRDGMHRLLKSNRLFLRAIGAGVSNYRTQDSDLKDEKNVFPLPDATKPTRAKPVSSNHRLFPVSNPFSSETATKPEMLFASRPKAASLDFQGSNLQTFMLGIRTQGQWDLVLEDAQNQNQNRMMNLARYPIPGNPAHLPEPSACSEKYISGVDEVVNTESKIIYPIFSKRTLEERGKVSAVGPRRGRPPCPKKAQKEAAKLAERLRK